MNFTCTRKGEDSAETDVSGKVFYFVEIGLYV